MKESTRNEIIRLYYGGTSMRKIADALHVSRHTVKRVLTEHDGGRSGESPSSRRKRPSQLDAYEATILALLERYPEITAMRVLEELRKKGFSGGYTIVKERVGRLRPRRRKQPVMRFETSPGAQAQMDYATYTIDFTEEGPRRVQLFSYILGYSRRQYIRFVERQDFATTIRQHVRAFEHLGGVAATCLYDNMKVVVPPRGPGGGVGTRCPPRCLFLDRRGADSGHSGNATNRIGPPGRTGTRTSSLADERPSHATPRYGGISTSSRRTNIQRNA